MIFAEAEEDTVLRAAIAFHEGGYGTPILVDQNERVRESLQGLECDPANLEIHNARILQSRVAPSGGQDVPLDQPCAQGQHACHRSEEHTSELQSLMRISYAVFCLKKKTPNQQTR